MSIRAHFIILFFLYLPFVALCLAALEAYGPRFLNWWLCQFTRRRGNLRRRVSLLHTNQNPR